VSPVLEIQKRMMLLGRVRLGQKGPKGEPQKLDRFRFTSPSRALLEAIAAAHGGEVTDWQGAPDEGYFQVTTDATRLDIILPPVFSDVDGSPTMPYSQWFEMWSAGGCLRRCDGETEALSGKPCMCDPIKRKAGAASECKLTTRVSFMLPDLPGLGVWRLDSHGWNAAVELPGTLDVLARAAHEQKFIPAVLSIQHRTSKSEGQTRRYIVPVIELPDVTLRQLASGDVPLALNAPVSRPLERPALPSGEAVLPADASFDTGPRAEFGEPPALPEVSAPALSDAAPSGDSDREPDAAVTAPAAGAETPSITAAQAKKLNVLIGKLRDDQKLISTEQLYGKCRREGTVGEDGLLHFGPLRDSLSKDEASVLIDSLEKFEANLVGEQGAWFVQKAREAQDRKARAGKL